MNWYPWLLFVHLAGAFVFVMGHGVSAAVAFRLRTERDVARIRAYLDLSSVSLTLVYVGLLVLLAGGIAQAFVSGLWDQLWIWVSLVLLLLIVGAMYPLGSGFYARVRHAVGMKSYQDKDDAPDPDVAPPEELDALLRGPQPYLLTLVGGGGFLIILWLMIAEPF